MAKRQLGAIDADLLRRVDEAAGDVPRVRWVERALEAALSAPDNGTGGGSPRSPSLPPGAASPRASEPIEKVQAKVNESRKARLAHAEASLSKRSVCPDHPDAGTTEVRGKLYCAEPGCPRVVGSPPVSWPSSS